MDNVILRESQEPPFIISDGYLTAVIESAAADRCVVNTNSIQMNVADSSKFDSPDPDSHPPFFPVFLFLACLSSVVPVPGFSVLKKVEFDDLNSMIFDGIVLQHHLRDCQ